MIDCTCLNDRSADYYAITSDCQHWLVTYWLSWFSNSSRIGRTRRRRRRRRKGGESVSKGKERFDKERTRTYPLLIITYITESLLKKNHILISSCIRRATAHTRQFIHFLFRLFQTPPSSRHLTHRQQPLLFWHLSSSRWLVLAHTVTFWFKSIIWIENHQK